MRLGEICALRWSDIDLKRRVIRVNNTMVRIQETEENAESKTKVIIDNPKREIPINRFLCSILKEKQEQEKERYFLTGKRKYIEPRTYYSRYKKIRR